MAPEQRPSKFGVLVTVMRKNGFTMPTRNRQDALTTLQMDFR